MTPFDALKIYSYDTFWCPLETIFSKTLWEKEKLLVTSNFSFSHNVFYPIWHLFFILTHYQTTNFRLFQTERVCRRKWKKVIQKMAKLWVEKTLWEKEKLLVTSNFSFSHSVFEKIISKGHQKLSLCGNGLNAFQNVCKIVSIWTSVTFCGLVMG